MVPGGTARTGEPVAPPAIQGGGTLSHSCASAGSLLSVSAGAFRLTCGQVSDPSECLASRDSAVIVRPEVFLDDRKGFFEEESRFGVLRAMNQHDA